MAGVELATAWVKLVPSMEGATDNIVKSLAPSGVGDKAGQKLGDDVAGGLSKKSAVIMGAVGGAVASLANSALGAVTNLFNEAVTASDATDKFVQTLSFAGLDTKGIDNATKAARSYADRTVYDLSTIQNTTAQLAANGIKDYTGLTEAAGNLNAVAGGNAETFGSVAMVLTQTAGAGKLTTENWNQLADAIPGASGRLQEALAQNGAYTGNFRDAMAAGQITADEFNTALMQLGTEPVAVEAATSVATMEGAVGNLAASVTGVLSDAFTAIKPVLTPLISGFADFIANADVFVPTIAGIAGVLLVALAPAIWGAVTATWAFTVALLANPLTWVAIAVGLLIAAIVALVMNWDTVVAWITDVWGGFIDWLVTGLLGFVDWWNGLWAGFSSWITDMWNLFVTGIQILWFGFVIWLMGIVDGLVSWWNGIWTGVGDFFRGLWEGIVGFVQTYVSTMQSIIMGVVGAIASWWNGLWAGIGSFFRGIWDGLISVVQNVGSAFSNVFNGIRNAITNAFSGIVSIVKAPINGIIGLVNGAIGALNGLSVKIPDWVPGVGGQTFGVKLPRIPQLAAGATILPRSGGTLAVLAEAGQPESVVDTGLMNRALEEGLSGNGQQGMVVQGPLVQVDQMVVDSDERVDEVAQALWERGERAQRAQGNVNLDGAVVA